jgi:HEAT repeat protein
METLGTFRDERALPYALEGLFLFEPGSPAMRVNDVAAMTLVRIGASVVPPLVALLRGDDGEVRPLVNAYIDAVHAQSPDTELSVARVVAGEAAYVLGTLGDPAAYDALLDAAGDDDPDRRLVALLALARLDIDARPANRVRALIESAYPDMPLESQAQLLGVIQRRIDPESLPFLVSVARGGRTDDVLRVLAFRAASLVALGRETRPLASIRLPDTVAPSPTLTLGTRCARDLDCWLGATEAADGDSLERVAYALARLGVDTVSPEDGARIRAALYDLLGHPEVRVRLSALTALDHLGAGRETATRIHQMAAAEEGRSTWRAFATAALPDAARFEAREARRVE